MDMEQLQNPVDSVGGMFDMLSAGINSHRDLIPNHGQERTITPDGEQKQGDASGSDSPHEWYDDIDKMIVLDEFEERF